MNEQAGREGVRGKLRMLTGAAKRYIQFPFGELDYGMIAGDLTAVSGAAHAAVNIYLPEKNATVTMGLAASSKIMDRVEAMIGHRVRGREWPLDDFARNSLYASGTGYAGSLHEIAREQIPAVLLKTLESMFNVRDVWSVGLRQGDEILGNLVFLMPADCAPPDTDLTDAFSEIVTQLLLRKRAEAELKRLLEEKELILRESHHRIKNNLALVASLVSLQGELLPDDQGELLNPIGRRINAIALIHEQLHGSGGDGKSVRFHQYLRKLVQELADSFFSEELELHIDVERADEAVMEDSKAIPLGIIVTELVMNSVKHAFTGMSRGRVRVAFSGSNGEGVLSVSDDGRGVGGSEPEPESGPSSLGMMLVDSLTAQLSGSVIWETGLEGRGASVRIVFPYE